MRALFVFLFTLLIMLVVHEASAAELLNLKKDPGATTTCKIKTDLGEITGVGTNIHEARSRASEICFDRRLAQYEALRGGTPGGEQADLLIESCVNIRCR